jgi:molybdopterin converting factor small subunit
MKVHVPTPLQSYTGGKHLVETNGASVGEMLAELDRRYPGMRFRIIDEQDGIRPHIKIFVNQYPVRELAAPTRPDDVVHIVCALSGG